MFDFAWTEIALIGVVALIAIGPKDMPVALKTLAELIKKARRMAGEFQSHVDEMVKDTELADVRNQISQLRNFDLRGEVKRAIDPDGSLHTTLAEDPFRDISGNPLIDPAPGSSAVIGQTAMTETVVAERGSVTFAPPEGDPVPRGAVPSFVPPAFVPPESVPPAVSEPPSFIPPDAQASRELPSGQPAAPTT